MGFAARHATAAVLLAATAGCHAARGGSATSGTLVITHAVIPASPADAEASAFLVVENHGSAEVTLLGATSPDADSIQMHRVIGGQMQPALHVSIAAGSDVRFVPGGYHLMLAGLKRPLAIGDTIRLELRFEPGGAVTVRAPVLNYTDAVSDLPSR